MQSVKKQLNPSKNFKEMELHKSAGILDDFAVRKSVITREINAQTSNTTDVVTNLNADLLDGNHSTAFEAANANIQAHISDNTQAHSDYLINNGNDSTSGILTANSFIATLQVKVYNVSAAVQFLVASDGAPGTTIFTASRQNNNIIQFAPYSTGGFCFTKGVQIGEAAGTAISHGLSVRYTTNDGNSIFNGLQLGTGRVIYSNRNVSSATRPVVQFQQQHASGGTQPTVLITQCDLDQAAIIVNQDGNIDGTGITFKVMSNGDTTTTGTITGLSLTSLYSVGNSSAITTNSDGDMILSATNNQIKIGGNTFNTSTNEIIITGNLEVGTINTNGTYLSIKDQLTCEGNVFFQQALMGFSISASDTLLLSADTERSSAETTYTKIKEIKTYCAGAHRVKFDLKTAGAGDVVNGKIYKNGVALGTEQSDDTGSYVTKSEDLTFAAGDLIQLYIKKVDAANVYVQNLRVYGAVKLYGSVDTD